jgi:hypothetical protein
MGDDSARFCGRAGYEDGAAARDWAVTFQIYGVLELLMYAT